MAGLLNRAKSVFQRKPKDQEDFEDDGGPISPVVGPNGVVTGHPHQHPPHHNSHPPPPHQHPHPHQPQHHPRPHPHPGDGSNAPATETGQLQVALHNDTNSSDVYAYISKFMRTAVSIHFRANATLSWASHRPRQCAILALIRRGDAILSCQSITNGY
jgi:hypothetical protein